MHTLYTVWNYQEGMRPFQEKHLDTWDDADAVEEKARKAFKSYAAEFPDSVFSMVVIPMTSSFTITNSLD